MDFKDPYGVEARLKRLRGQMAKLEAQVRENPLQRSLHREQAWGWPSPGGRPRQHKLGDNFGPELFPSGGWTREEEEERLMGGYSKRFESDLERRRLEREREAELRRRREEERARADARRHWERAHRLLLEAEGEARMAEEAWRRASRRHSLW
jgi:hypothetical protein